MQPQSSRIHKPGTVIYDDLYGPWGNRLPHHRELFVYCNRTNATL